MKKYKMKIIMRVKEINPMFLTSLWFSIGFIINLYQPLPRTYTGISLLIAFLLSTARK